jgi:photosystem II stability/assembly factor-like uncharacterized protein
MLTRYRKSVTDMRRSLQILGLILLLASPVRSQWRIVASKVVQPDPAHYSGSVLLFKDGVLWAGDRSIAYSLDTGKTWHDATRGNHLVSDFLFIRRDTGYMADDIALWKTTDRGQTWKWVLWGRYCRLLPGNTPRSIHALDPKSGSTGVGGSGYIATSFDGFRRAVWLKLRPDQLPQALALRMEPSMCQHGEASTKVPTTD